MRSPFVLALLAVVACSEPDGPGRRAAPALPAVTEEAAAEAPAPEPLPYVELRTAGAGEGAELPMVVALHGRGSDETRFLRFFEGYPTPARIISVQAPVDEGNGRAWWSFRGKSGAEVAAEMRGLAERIVATTRAAEARYPTRGLPALTGFSQGAMLVYLLALEHPRVFGRAISVAGVLFDRFVPDALPAGVPPIVALHGSRDPVIPPSSERRSIASLQARGADARYREFDDVPHWIMGELKTALHEELAAPTPPRGAPSSAPR
ncbi:MAG: alpha/beta hydrolase-fold protein [Myxococcota bacterium]